MTLSRMALIVKVGDQEASIKCQHMIAKEGMPISLILEKEWGKTLEEICPPNHVFAIVEVDPAYEQFYRDILQPLNPDKFYDARYYRCRKMVLTLNTISEKIGSADLVKRLRGSDKIGIIDGRSLVPTDFLDSLTYTTPYNIVPDRNIITSGTHNIGSGETYTTVAAFAADVGNLTADLTGVLQSTVTESSTALFSFTLNGYMCKLTSSAESYGYPNVGYIVQVNHTGIGLDCTTINANGSFELEKFYLKSVNTTYADQPLLRVAGNHAVDFIIHDIMLDANNHRYCYRSQGTVSVRKVFNVIGWDAVYTCYDFSGVNANDIIENCNAYNSGNDYGFGFLSKVFTARNLVSFGNRIDYQGTTGLSSFLSCASQDTTGTTGLVSLTPSNELLSLDDTNDNFMYIKPGSTIDGAGTTSILTENTECIRNNPRPNYKTEVSCGATEIPANLAILTLRGGFKSTLLGGFQ